MTAVLETTWAGTLLVFSLLLGGTLFYCLVRCLATIFWMAVLRPRLAVMAIGAALIIGSTLLGIIAATGLLGDDKPFLRLSIYAGITLIVAIPTMNGIGYLMLRAKAAARDDGTGSDLAGLGENSLTLVPLNSGNLFSWLFDQVKSDRDNLYVAPPLPQEE